MYTCKGAVKLLQLEYRPAEPIGDVLVSAAILFLAVNILMLTNLKVLTYKFPRRSPSFSADISPNLSISLRANSKTT